jgi:hypothetical protein
MLHLALIHFFFICQDHRNFGCFIGGFLLYYTVNINNKYLDN